MKKLHLGMYEEDPIEDSGAEFERDTIGPGIVVAAGIGLVVAVTLVTAFVKWVL